jgi:L-ascorbate metabolism protein UlaG (beta-lactamase superfamily)
MSSPRLTLIGGPTVLIEIAGFRLLTDPTFDAPGDYHSPRGTLSKTKPPALHIDHIGNIDAVLLSHDQHSDNLDHAGREFLQYVPRVLTTDVGAKRLGGNAQGLAPWQSTELTAKDGRRLRITATPARHGPAGIEPLLGDVIGFVVEGADAPAIYVTGDTVWYEGVAEVARRFKIGIVLLFAGAAQTRAPFHLTMDNNDALETAQAFANAAIVPVHCDGWMHFKQSCEDLGRAFDTLGFGSRLRLLQPGVAERIDLPDAANPA